MDLSISPFDDPAAIHRKLFKGGMGCLGVTAVTAIAFAIVVPGWGCTCGAGRSKVSRVRSDHRSMATALESYYMDQGAYPPMQPMIVLAPDSMTLLQAGGRRMTTFRPGTTGALPITTPVAYITGLPTDPFAKDLGTSMGYFTDGPGWILTSPGPDGDYDLNPRTAYDSSISQPSLHLLTMAGTYDPTNGTASSGDVWRVKE